MAKKKSFWERLKQRLRDDQERGARENIMEDLFNDFNRNRFTVYKFNFVRGIFFGFGSVLGGTLVLAIFVWLLNLTGQLIPGVGGFVQSVTHSVEQGTGK